MKSKNITYFAIILLSIFMAGCASTPPVVINKPLNKGITGKVVLVNTVLDERVKQLLPLLDAGIYNTGVDQIKGKLAAIDTESMAAVNQVLLAEAQKCFSGGVSTTENPWVENGVVKYDNFQKLNPSVTSKVKELAGTNGAEIVIASIARVNTVAVGAFGVNGTTVIDMVVYFFDKDGGVVGQATIRTPNSTGGAQDIAGYKGLFENLKLYIPDVFAQLKSSKS